MGIWPLPGGVDKYAETLEKCLAHVARSAPTFEDLMKWFVDNYPGVKGGRSTQGYVYTVKEVLRLAEEGSDGRLRPTREGSEYLKSKDREFLFKILDSRVAGISEIVDIVRSGPLSLTDLHVQLKGRLKKEWETENQTFFRVAWLMSLGKIRRVGHNYVLSGGMPSTVGSRQAEPTTREVVTESSLGELVHLLHKTEKDTSDPRAFEDVVARCFGFLGFESRHIGGSGKADVLLTANLGGTSYKVVIDAKTSTTRLIEDSRIDWLTLEEHKRKNGAKYSVVVGTGFESDRVRERAAKTGTTLISTTMLEEVMKLHEATPFDLVQLEDLFKEKGIPTTWRDLLEQYASDLDANCSLLSNVLELLGTTGRELSVAQVEAVLNTKGVQCSEEQVRLIMGFLAAPPMYVARENENGKFSLRTSPVTIARKLGMIQSRIKSLA